MTSNNKCLLLPDAGDNAFFPGQRGEHATQTGGIQFFGDQMAARVYIDKHGIDHIVCIRPIRQQSEALMSPPLSFSLYVTLAWRKLWNICSVCARPSRVC